MDLEKIGRWPWLNWLLKPAGISMASPLRKWLHDPDRILRAAGIQPGQHVLEVGCGPGFFSIPAARILGPQGRLFAMDTLESYVETVAKKARHAGLHNIETIQRDALNTRLEDESMDAVLLFGVLPFPTLPLNRLLPEVHRVLKPKGRLALWQFPVDGWVPGTISKSELFIDECKRDGVHVYRRV